ncbi:MAG: penicillin-binding transpeptidase domain-containing protein [Planctomycetota bacterium]|jgi:penicillin-binding protein 2
MYDKRIKIFIILSALLLAVCLLRLTQMQLLPGSSVQDDIAELKRGPSLQLKTIRGKILDRTGKVLAADEPRFWVHINYRLSSFLDERVQQGKLLRAAGKPDPELVVSKMEEEIRDGLEDLQQIIDKCTYFGLERNDIEAQIRRINDKVWNLRKFLAWARNNPDPKIIEKNDGRTSNVPLSEAIADFHKKFPDKNDRLLLVDKVNDIPEMNKNRPLLGLKTDDDVFTAQLEFLNVDGVQILPKSQRSYPFGTVAAQTIGWVGPATQKQDKELFANDRLSSYLGGELSGREDGVEYVCETILRGRRGELVYNIDQQLIGRTETQFGKDVSLTLDIELQQRIENYLAGYEHDPNCGPGMAAVVVDVATGDILALVSMPVFDLNRTRYDYGALVNDSNEPLINRAINKQYPPGSIVKPLILIAGLESAKIAPDEIINCPAQKAPKGWPSCLIYNRHRLGHDGRWQSDGGNSAHNAIKGSCNIYFSRLADRIYPWLLQQWLFKFGYGHDIPLAPNFRPSGIAPRASSIETRASSIEHRDLRQAPGIISSSIPGGEISNLEQLPLLRKGERRFFGIGQGNLRVTPLQIANAMAAIARGGFYKRPRLFLEGSQEPASNENRESSIYLNISPQTLAVIYDGMSAVVNESGGTAYTEFAPVLGSLAEQGTKVYGKTGSTEAPENAWFAGFATDGAGRSISIAVVVEGGQHGSSDAAPLARDIIQFCIDAEYIGLATN